MKDRVYNEHNLSSVLPWQKENKKQGSTTLGKTDCGNYLNQRDIKLPKCLLCPLSCYVFRGQYTCK